ncbi:MAG: MBL fold hydrolase [Acidobacteria bacterium]|nr:MAG: MBL fold hydrolase [Acidobacteriota bacterium]
MIAREIVNGVSAIVAIDWDRRFFDELIPLPKGTTYNSYIVRGSEKIALIDTMYPARTDEYIASLKSLKLPRIDYVIANHGEQDHSGSIPAVLALYPEARVVTNKVCRQLITHALDVPADSFLIVGEGDTISLGDRTLRFLITPWVHWPDTMITHLVEDNLLFTCDLFGAHFASTDLFAIDKGRVLEAARSYYAEIMMPFRPYVAKYMDMIDKIAPRMICPSHGPIHNRPAVILDPYRQWVSDVPQPEVVIPHVSMYNNTSSMVLYLVDRLIERGLKVTPYNVLEGNIGDVASALVTASTLVVAASTVLGGAHPASAGALTLINALKPKVRFAATIGSFGWASAIEKNVTSALSNLKVEYLAPVIVNGRPGPDQFKELHRLADDIYERNKQFAPEPVAAD